MGDLNLAELLPAALPSGINFAAEQLSTTLSRAANGVGHRERWKYTPSRHIVDLLALPGTPPDWQTLPAGIVPQSTSALDVAAAAFGEHLAHAPEAVVNLCRQGELIVIDVNDVIQDPMIIDYTAASIPVLLRLGPNAEFKLIELTNADTDLHQMLWIELGAGAHLEHARQAFGNARAWQQLYVHQARDSHYMLHNHCNGAALRRQDVHIIAAESGSATEILSAAYLPEASHFDLQITMEHRAPHTSSRQQIHNIAGNRAKATCNGRIHIHQNAPGVDAELNNRNLTLGDAAVINSKPELEIYTDDVKCAHGATVGQLDADHLFYCASRGIGAAAAHGLLSRAFLASCTQGPRGEESLQRFSEYLA